MTAPPMLFESVCAWLKPAPWRDERHLQTVAWMVVGLLLSSEIALTKWVPYMVSRAQFAQSTQRRFERWLHNRRIPVLALYGALVRAVLGDFRDHRVYLALDTTLLWETYCVVYVGLVYRGRMIPLAWKVMDHPSASVAFRDYRGLLVLLRRVLTGRKVYLLADRGFVHLELMRWVKQTLDWHFRIRWKSGVGLYRWDGGRFVPLSWHASPGQAVCYHGVYATGRHEPVHLIVGWSRGAEEPWIVLSDEPTWPETLGEYALRFDIEEGFLDQKSNGFRWESSRLRDSRALRRLCFVMAVATLILVCQGSAVVSEGKRRTVDPHWFRGHSYARIGWDWIRRALTRGWALMPKLSLGSATDPEPARASKRQSRQGQWIKELLTRYVLLPEASKNPKAGA